MPNDPFEMRPANATVSLAAGGHLTALSYHWEHPLDGPQDGLLLAWTTDAGEAVRAQWADSWHQQPEPMSLSGTADDATLELEAGYGGDGWRWRIAVEATEPEMMRILMYNIIPAEHATDEVPAGPYPVMVTELAHHSSDSATAGA
jgi:hypothetical protein